MMAEQEISVVTETEDNPLHRAPSIREDQVEGRQANSGDLLQAIVAGQGLITALSSIVEYCASVDNHYQ